MDEAFKQVEEKLGINSEKEHKELIKVEKKEIISNESHEEDIKKDYQKIRESIINNMDSAEEIMRHLEEGIINSEDDRYMPRKAEVFSTLLKTSIDLRKELMELHKSKKDLLKTENTIDNPAVKTKMTTNDIKALFEEDDKNKNTIV